MNPKNRMPVYGMLVGAAALLLLVPMQVAAAPQTYSNVPALVETHQPYQMPCDNIAACSSGQPSNGVSVSVWTTSNPFCVHVKITISVKVGAYVYPPGTWVWIIYSKTITNTTCIYSSKNIQLLDHAMDTDGFAFLDNLNSATYSGVADNGPATGPSLLRFSALDREGQEIGHFLVGSLL